MSKKIDLSKEFCRLPDFTREEVLLCQSAAQQYGWQIANFNMPEVWKETCGEGVVVAVIDSGCDLSHPDLKKCLLKGYNCINPNQEPVDQNGHGSHVTGIIAAENNDFGVVGVANCCKILPIQVLNRMGAGRMDHVVEAIKIAVDKGADLICMSLGTRNPLDQVHDAIKKAADAGVICFVAAGNAGSTKQLLYPAAYDITVSIGAINEDCMRADFSCTGPNLDFVAPGVDILSTVPQASYAIMSGTSQAAPFACGVAALILSSRRVNKPGVRLTKADYIAAMKTSIMNVKNLDEQFAEQGARFFQGFGIILPATFTEWVENRKVIMVAQNISNALGDLGMVKEMADVTALRKLSRDLQAKLKEFPKATALKATALKAASSRKKRVAKKS